MAMYNLVGSVRSPAVKISQFPSGDTFVIPYSKEMSMSVAHQTFEPIKEFFDWVRKTVTSAADFADSSLAVGADLIFRLQDMLGLKLYNKKYFRQAWAGTKPAAIALTLDFNRGSSGLWDAKAEVYDPIMKLMALGSPQEMFGIEDGALSGPIPGAVSAFGAYTLATLNSLGTTLGIKKSAT